MIKSLEKQLNLKLSSQNLNDPSYYSPVFSPENNKTKNCLLEYIDSSP